MLIDVLQVRSHLLQVFVQRCDFRRDLVQRRIKPSGIALDLVEMQASDTADWWKPNPYMGMHGGAAEAASLSARGIWVVRVSPSRIGHRNISSLQKELL